VEALKSPDAAGAIAATWAEVEVEALDERTVRFTLKTPIAGFLAAATQPLLPAHLLSDVPFADLATDAFATLPVGTGPYVLAELDDTRAVLVPAALLPPPVEEEPEASPSPSLDPPTLASAAPSRRCRPRGSSSVFDDPAATPPRRVGRSTAQRPPQPAATVRAASRRTHARRRCRRCAQPPAGTPSRRRASAPRC
jgi:hypothetical protein